MSIFEAIMLICFGLAWPVNIFKSLRSHATAGKSPLFLIVIQVGYVAGILHKLLYSQDWVLGLYVLNLLMVSIDLVLYYRNRRLEIQSSGIAK